MTDSSASVTPASQDTSFFGHPKGLAILFLTEMWERFSYYGMRAILIFYLTQHFLFSDQRSTLIYGAYIALVYVMTIIGGTLADRYLGQKKAVTYGAILLVLGHGMMAFEGGGSSQYVETERSSYLIEPEGRGGDRQLFTNFNGELRRIVFDSETSARISSFADDGSDVIIISTDADGNPAYVFSEGERGIIQQVCAVFSLGCAGEEPTGTFSYADTDYSVVSRDETNSDGEVESVHYLQQGGREFRLAFQTETDLVILNEADRAAEPTAMELERLEHGTYEERVEQEQVYVYILYLALALIIAGVGFLKANISTIVGTLYGLGDTRRDSGFTLFYMGINLGSLLSYLTIAWIGVVYGWKWGFGLAGIGMLLGLTVFLTFQHWLKGKAEPPDPAKLKKKVFGPVNIEWACYLAGLAIIGISMLAVMNPQYVGGVLGPVGIVMFLALIGYSVFFTKDQERGQMLAATYFILAQIPFWALFEQAGGSLNLFTDRFVDRSVFGLQVPAPVFQAINPFFIVLLAPLFASAWVVLARHKLNPSTPVKFALGVFMAGLGFWVLVGGIQLSGAALVSVYFIFLIYFIHTVGELMLSPVGLSAVTKLAPARVVGMTMGAWFLYSGLSNYLSGVIGAATGADTIGGQLTDPEAAKVVYTEVYSQVGIWAMAIAVGMLLISPIIKKLMGDADATMMPHPEKTEAGGPSMDRSSGAP